MEANPSFWRGQVAIDEVIFRVFRNADAMVAALKSGEIDAAHDVPAATFPRLCDDRGHRRASRASRVASTTSC